MSTYTSLFIAGLFILYLMTGCSTRGHAMRPLPLGENTPLGRSWRIETPANGNVPVSCSFVEFDERGDYLLFKQHLDCQATIKSLANSNPENLLLVVYCHGWKNNSQSGDVLSFNAFLKRLAESDEIRQRKLRVHGVYLGWRGNVFRPHVRKTSDAFNETSAAFGEPITDSTKQRSFRWLYWLPENLSYWNRKNAAENKVSGLPIARSIFTYAIPPEPLGGPRQQIGAP